MPRAAPAMCADADVEMKHSKTSETSPTRPASDAESAASKSLKLNRDPYIAAVWYAQLPQQIGDFYCICLEGLQPDTWEVVYTFRYVKGEPTRKISVFPRGTEEFMAVNTVHCLLVDGQKGLTGLKRVMVRGRSAKLRERLVNRGWVKAARLPWLE